MRKIDLWGVAVKSCLVVLLFSCTNGGPKISDNQIVKESLERLRMDAQLDSDNIHVESKNQIVTLTGHVDKLYEKYLAEAIVGSTRLGIRDIINEINVITPAVDDQIIADVGRHLYAAFAPIDGGLQHLLQCGIVVAHQIISRR